jgi:hypothetical protein
MTSQSPKHLTFPIWRILMAAVKIRTLSLYNCVRIWDIARAAERGGRGGFPQAPHLNKAPT